MKKSKRELIDELRDMKKREQEIKDHLARNYKLYWTDNLGWVTIPNDDEDEG